jgi:hypothetical protein
VTSPLAARDRAFPAPLQAVAARPRLKKVLTCGPHMEVDDAEETMGSGRHVWGVEG